MGSITAQSYSRAANNDTTTFSPAVSNAAAFVFFQSLLNLAGEHGAPIFCHDKFPTRKLNVYPAYKEARFQRYKDAIANLNLIDPELGKHETPPQAEPSVFQQFRTALNPILKTLPAVHAYSFGEEADDTLFTMAVHVSHSGTKVSVYSRDTDMMQICALPLCRLILKKGANPAKIIQEHDVTNQYGVRADQVALYKAFLGDNGDSIPGMGTMHSKYVISDIIGNRTTVDEVYDAWNNGDINYDKWHKGWYEIFEHHLGYRLAEELDDQGNYVQLLERGTGQAFINEKLARLNPDCNIVYEYYTGDYMAFEAQYNALAGTMARHLPAVDVWNKMVSFAKVTLAVFEKGAIPLNVVESELSTNLI
ncbi:hypothetical protein NFB51_15975 [Yersinia ruckeri]|nr:hypothetical protein [Yersinia ruckeri]